MKENISLSAFSKEKSLIEGWTGCPVHSDEQQSDAALPTEQPGGNWWHKACTHLPMLVKPSPLRMDVIIWYKAEISLATPCAATANFQVWFRVVLFWNSCLSYTQFSSLLLVTPVLAPCCIYTKCHQAKVTEDPCWWAKHPLFSTGQGMSWASPLLTSRSFTQLVLTWLCPGSPCRPSHCRVSSCPGGPDAPPVFPEPLRKKEQGLGPLQSSVIPFAGQHGAKRHEKERAEIKVFLVPASSWPFWSRVVQTKAKQQLCRAVFPALQGNVGG